MPFLADALLDNGFTPEQARRAVHAFTRRIPEMAAVVDRDARDQAEIACEQAIARRRGPITFQVRVFSSTKNHHKVAGSCHPQYEHLVEVLAADQHEARLVAAQMAACHADDPMPLSAEVVTDSTLTVL